VKILKPKSTVRHLYAASILLLSLVVFRSPLIRLVNLSLHDDAYSYIVFMPLISAFLIYIEKHRIFLNLAYSPSIGGTMLLLGSTVYSVDRYDGLGVFESDRLSAAVLVIVLIWVGGFALCYGKKSAQAAAFPLCLMLFMIPLPAIVLSKIVAALQSGSAEVTYAIFKVAHIPVLRQGLKFSLPGVDIEIAQECSGIRSSMSLFIVGLIAGHIFLKSAWRKVCFSVATIFVVIFKNGVRIATLSWLGVYVDREFLYGSLHHRYGGLVFSLLAFAILLPLLMLLHEPGGLLDEATSSG
jgi:exosortase